MLLIEYLRQDLQKLVGKKCLIQNCSVVYTITEVHVYNKTIYVNTSAFMPNDTGDLALDEVTLI